jgi:hypothetical protein
MSVTNNIEKPAYLHNTNDNAIHNEPHPRESSEKGSGDTKIPKKQDSLEIEEIGEETYDSFLDGWRLQVLNTGCAKHPLAFFLADDFEQRAFVSLPVIS